MRIPPLSLPLIALILGILGYAVFSSLHPVAKPVVFGKTPEPGIDYVDLSHVSVRSDQALLEDSAPLFLATPWNASFAPEDALSGDIVDISIYPPELHALTSPFFVEGPELAFARPPPRAISHGSNKPFTTLGLGKGRPAMKKKPPNRGILMINRVGDPNEKYSFPLPAALLDKSKTGLWTPVEFFCTIENLTAIGSPAQTKSSGLSELDDALSRFAQQQASSNGLPAGYYRITAYP